VNDSPDLSPLMMQLRRDEGLKLFPYTDTTGNLTIGVGRNLTGVGISAEEAEYLLGNDIYRAVGSLSKVLPWADRLDDARHGALVNMTFNLGIGGLLQFENFLASMRAGDWKTAAADMLDSKWAEQVGLRAKRLSQQILLGTWQ
jgi:lysozyme